MGKGETRNEFTALKMEIRVWWFRETISVNIGVSPGEEPRKPPASFQLGETGLGNPSPRFSEARLSYTQGK